MAIVCNTWWVHCVGLDMETHDFLSAQLPADDSRARRDIRISVGALLLFIVINLVFSSFSRGVGQNTTAGQGATIGGILLALALVWATQRKLGRGFSELGLSRPHSWPRTVGLGIGVAVLSQVVVGTALTLIQPLLGGELPDVSRFDSVRGNLPTMVGTVLAVWITSAFPEEVIWRGFLITRIAGLAGGSRPAWIVALLLSSAHFGMIHSYQGVSGMVGTGLAGLLYGVAFLVLGRNLWIVIVAHASSHLLSFTMLYLSGA